MKSFVRVASVGLALGLAGCAAIYTSIEPAEDGSFTLTRIDQGFLTVSGAVERCEVSGDRFRCKEVAD